MYHIQQSDFQVSTFGSGFQLYYLEAHLTKIQSEGNVLS